MAREKLSKRVRFDVFKQDGFTCQYCGRKPPAVTLEVDHIVPVVEGGGNEIENLVTSCFDCNRGKATGTLDSRAPFRDMKEQAEIILEREEQLKAYHEAKQAEVARRDRDFNMCWNHWFDVWGQDSLSNSAVPWRNQLRRSVDILGTAEVMEAMDITGDKFRYANGESCRYFGGIIKRKIALVEGRIVPCTICGKDCILEPGADITKQWHHTACAEDKDG